MDTFVFMSNRIRELRLSAGLSQEELAERAGTKKAQISKLETGERRLTQDWMTRIARPLGVEPAELIAAKGRVAAPDTKKGDGERTLAVLEVDVRVTGGSGGAAHLDMADRSEPVIAEWRLPSDMLRSQTTAPPEGLRIIRVIGDSMAPMFNPGEKVLVDTGDRLPTPPGIFVVWDGFGLVIKRVEMIANSEPAMMRLKSVNVEYESYERPMDDATINGRVIGKWLWT